MHWLLLFAGVNVVMSLAVALPVIARRRYMPRRLALAGVPALWALLMRDVYGYLQATMPPFSDPVGSACS